MRFVYYNEIDSFCCEWLRQLIKHNLLPDGEIDNRSIEDVRPDDLKGFTQCHFFAGIGGWPYALQQAGWSDNRPVWTGSCPCQPFSTAGKRAGTSDERHLWPSFFWLISQCKPDIVIGEQVASKDALAWWDIIHTDLEGTGYACGVQDTSAASVGAPHIRQRLYWLGYAQPKRLEGYTRNVKTDTGKVKTRPVAETGATLRITATNGFWRNPDWLWCRDKKWRPFIPAFPLLVDGIPCALGYDCSTDRAKEGITNALLPILREIIGTKKVSEWLGRLDAFWETQVLQSDMYGTCDGKGSVSLCPPQPRESSSNDGRQMRFMWGEREITCASFERRPYRQHPLQFDDLVPFLPPQSSFTKFCGCKWTATALQILWEACCENWPVLHTLGAFAPLWASFSEEDKNRLRLAVSSGSWRTLQTSPTWDVGAFARKRNIRQRLQGYGNAIVVPQAVEFVKCVMEVLNESTNY